MVKRLLPALLIVLAFDVSASAKDARKRDPYFPLTAIHYQAFLPDPPAEKSAADVKELDAIVEMQKSLTDEEKSNMTMEAKYDTYLIFQDTIGPWFTEDDVKKLPALHRLLQREADTTGEFVTSAKEFWKRPRPYLQDPRVQSQLGKVDGFSYPSGHSTRGAVDSYVLAKVFPSVADGILKRGVRVGDDRVLAGVHFRTDVEAGRTLAGAIFDRLMKNREFRADLAAAEAEMRH
jgi:acid phosphatase (class A)